ncbi:MAG: hypothetical protein WC229_02330 [Candidatus Paceibacterota bacterium]|jgi:hypothetical protein
MKYYIEHKIKTLSHLNVGIDKNLPEPLMNIDGYIFKQWSFNYRDGWGGDAWIVSKTIESNSCTEAINLFRENLDKILRKIAFVSQCYMEFYIQSFFILREDGNAEKKIWFRFSNETEGVPLHFDNEELDNYEKIKTAFDNNAFRYLQEANNCQNYVPRLMLLFSALEAMSGRVEKEKTKEDGSIEIYYTYNKETMIKIMGGDLYNEIFGTDGIRHKINHGDYVENVSKKFYTELIHYQILDYCNKNLNTNFDLKIVSPGRSFYGNYSITDFFIKPKDLNASISLKNFVIKEQPLMVEGFVDIRPFDTKAW